MPPITEHLLLKNLQGNISSMCGDESFADFTFIVKGKEFKVHKNILAASSVVMQKLFTAEYEEKKTGKCDIDDIEPHIFEALLRFVYSYKSPENLREIACVLYKAAHYYEIQSLKEVCLEEIQNNLGLTADNFIEAYKLAFQFNLEKLKANAWDIIKRDFLKVSLPSTVQPLPLSKVAEILTMRKKEQDIYNEYDLINKVASALVKFLGLN